MNFLRNTGLYTLNNRLPCPDASTHQPAYTRVRPAPPGQANASAQRSILDYVLMPPKYVLTEPHQVRPLAPCRSRLTVHSPHLIISPCGSLSPTLSTGPSPKRSHSLDPILLLLLLHGSGFA
jgi:hypothetical protein